MAQPINDPRRDPSWRPSEKRILGAPIREPRIVEKEPVSTSMFPAAVKEAKTTRFQVSLFLFMASVAGGVYVGREWGRGISRAEVETLQAKQGAEIAAVKSSCQSCVTSCTNNGTAITTLDGRVQSQSGEIAVIKSKLDDINRRH